MRTPEQFLATWIHAYFIADPLRSSSCGYCCFYNVSFFNKSNNEYCNPQPANNAGVTCSQISDVWKVEKHFCQGFFYKLSSPWILHAIICSGWEMMVVLLLEALRARLAMSTVTSTSNQLEQIYTLKHLVLGTWHLCCTRLKGFYFRLALIWSQGPGRQWRQRLHQAGTWRTYSGLVSDQRNSIWTLQNCSVMWTKAW